MTRKLTLIGLLLCTSIFAEQNTVFKHVIISSTVDPSLSGPVTNIGQTSHLAFVIFSDTPGHTCNAVTTSSQFDAPQLDIHGSWDGVNYNPITNTQRGLNVGTSGPTDRYRAVSDAVGSYPYIEVSVENWDHVNCQADVYYAGAMSTPDINKTLSFGTFYDPLKIGQFSATVAGTYAMVVGLTNARVTVYGMLINNSVSQQITVEDVRKDSAAVPWMILPNFPASYMLWPTSTVPYFQTSINGTLTLVTTATSNVSGYVIAAGRTLTVF